MKVGVIFTGGTIGSHVDQSGYIATRQTAPFLLLEQYRENGGCDAEFIIREPYRILSENLQWSQLNLLINTVTDLLAEDALDGIIVTHGTDTLQYSAAVLGYVFANCEVPIVLVSSNYVLEDNRANGGENFKYAMEFIKNQCGRGVFVSYKNTGDIPRIHQATRLQSSISYTDDVFSIKDSEYGSFVKDLFVNNDKYKIANGREDLLADSSYQLRDCSREILVIFPYVGMRYPKLTSEVKVVLHGSFHSGTINVTEEFCRFMQEAMERKIPVYLTGLAGDEHAYDSVREYQEQGLIPLTDRAFIAQYCKLWIAVSNDLDIKETMETCVANDWLANIE